MLEHIGQMGGERLSKVFWRPAFEIFLHGSHRKPRLYLLTICKYLPIMVVGFDKDPVAVGSVQVRWWNRNDAENQMQMQMQIQV